MDGSPDKDIDFLETVTKFITGTYRPVPPCPPDATMKIPSESDYAGYGWIKVTRYQDDPNLSCEERYQRLEKHHVAETTFLIEEVRKLARLVEKLQKNKQE